MESVIIFGSGYGLYGYLPSAIFYGFKSIKINIEYREKLKSRNDISKLDYFIDWYKKEKEEIELESVDSVIIALRPIDQYKQIKKCLKFKNIQNYVIEKPISNTPKNSFEIINLLKKNNINYNVGYNFRHTKWGSELINHNNHQQIKINWEFNAHHYKKEKHTWKRNEIAGGGALRFYGIHLIALISQLKYTNVIFSELYYVNNENTSWKARITNSENSIFSVYLNTKTKAKNFSCE